MLARLEDLVESWRDWWELETAHRRRMLRLLAHWMATLVAASIRFVIWVGVAIVAVAIEWNLAYYMNRGPRLLIAVAIFVGFVILKRSYRRIRTLIQRYLRRMPLLPTVLLATTGGAGIAWFSWWSLDRILRPTAKSPDPIDITKLALTVAGGVGAVVALVVAYRRQRDVEQSRFVERFGAAAEQMGASQVAVRIAGVYAMAGVADESKGLQRQQCIDVLCGYLRLPYSPDRGSNYQTKRVEKLKNPNVTDAEVEDHFEYPQNDREVRRTILRVIGDRLRSSDLNWSDASFDLRGAYLEDADFARATIRGEVRFRGATLAGETSFHYARLSGHVIDFGEVTFAGKVRFFGTRFESAIFEKATFGNKAAFYGVEFEGDADFTAAKFVAVDFSGTHFWGMRASFERCRFEGPAKFAEVSFNGLCSFEEAKFRDRADFATSFRRWLDFHGADFGSHPIDFSQVWRWGISSTPFDWSENRSQKPPNVKPTPWPQEFP